MPWRDFLRDMGRSVQTEGLDATARRAVASALGEAGRRAGPWAAQPRFSQQLFALDEEHRHRPQLRAPARRMLWVVPRYQHIAYGGVYTILRLMAQLAAAGVEQELAIFCPSTGVPVDARVDEIGRHFPALAGLPVSVVTPDPASIDELPEADVAVATWWETAYVVARYRPARRRMYLVQDFEPGFYAAGSDYALAEDTYRFGFDGIFNTPGLAEAITSQYDMRGVAFTPAVDPVTYHPPAEPRAAGPTRIFFYARPSAPRNAFELGINAIQQVVARFGPEVEVVMAGERCDARRFGLGDQVVQLGLLPGPAAVGDLYRTCDIGFVFMLTKHPSYQPFEYMASGMATVVNANEANRWFFEDGTNCLVAAPNPRAVADAIGRLVTDLPLRGAVRAGGLGAVQTDWQAALRPVVEHLTA